jgi:hypothetical protein
LHKTGIIRIGGGKMSEKPSILTNNGGASNVKFPLFEVSNPLSRRVGGSTGTFSKATFW